jgi:hypothetical protein
MDATFPSRGMAWSQPVDDRHVRAPGLVRHHRTAAGPAEALEGFIGDHRPGQTRPARARLLSRSQSYAEHWLSFWNDLLRNDYKGTGYIDGGRKQITGWLYTALARNLPYDRLCGRARPSGLRGGGLHPGHPLARRGEREHGAADAGGAERRPGFPRREPEVRLVPRQLHQRIHARRRLWAREHLCRRAARNRRVRQADGHSARRQVLLRRDSDRTHARLSSPDARKQQFADASPARAEWPAAADDGQPTVAAFVSDTDWSSRSTRWTCRRGRRNCSTGWPRTWSPTVYDIKHTLTRLLTSRAYQLPPSMSAKPRSTTCSADRPSGA